MRPGLRSITFFVRGKNAYGMLESERGVHRLVRISPFDQQHRRQTSFAEVDVVPEIEEGDVEDIEIRPEDLRVETFKAGGAGGQYVNKTESAVRIIHVPTNTIVASQQERSQMQNRDVAMYILRAKLVQREREEREAKLEELRGERRANEWGSQIRSYTLNPFQLVKDHRTGVETGNTEARARGRHRAVHLAVPAGARRASHRASREPCRPRIDVIVVCWNDKEKIATALDSVFALGEVRADPGFANVVVSDNGSTDGSREFIRERYGERVDDRRERRQPRLRRRPATARSRARRRRTSILLNPDAELQGRRAARTSSRSWTRIRAAGSPARASTTSTERSSTSCGEFDTWTGAFLRSSAWGEWPPLRRFANGAGLREFRLRPAAARRPRDRRRARDPAHAARRDRRLRRALLPLSRGGRFREARRGRGLGDVVRAGQRSGARRHGQRARASTASKRANSARAATYWIKHHGYALVRLARRAR